MQGLTATEFADRLNEIMPVIFQEFSRRQANELFKGKITLPQFLILDFLYRKGASKMNQLAKLTHVCPAAMTGIVDRLVRDGYVTRKDEPQDRRIIKVKLTTPGHELVRKITEQKRNMVVHIFGKISVHDRKEYLRILSKIKDILTKEGSDKA